MRLVMRSSSECCKSFITMSEWLDLHQDERQINIDNYITQHYGLLCVCVCLFMLLANIEQTVNNGMMSSFCSRPFVSSFSFLFYLFLLCTIFSRLHIIKRSFLSFFRTYQFLCRKEDESYRTMNGAKKHNNNERRKRSGMKRVRYEWMYDRLKWKDITDEFIWCNQNDNDVADLMNIWKLEVFFSRFQFSRFVMTT